VIIFVTGAISLLVAPNNWDSMTYHLPRTEHWYQNHSTWFYNTNIDRQLWMQSLNSHLFLIQKALHLPENSFNLIQYFAYIAILLILWRGLRNFNVPASISLSLVLVTATLPNFLAEAPTTQSDILAALTLLLNFIFLLELILSSSQKIHLILYGLTLAIVCFTKGTLFPYVVISGIVAAVILLRKYRWKSLYAFIFFLISTLLLNGFTWAQSLKLFGSISGPQTTPTRFIQSPISSSFWPSDIAVSFLHFFAYNAQSFSHLLNAKIFEICTKMATRLNLDLLAHGNSWPNWNPSSDTFTYIFQPSFGINEDSATSPQLIVIFVILIFLASSQLRKKTWIPLLVTTIAVGYLFAVIIILRWNPFVGRYYIPISILAIFCIGIFCSKTKSVKNVLIIVSLFGTIYSAPFLLRSEIRAVLGQNTFIGKNMDEQRFVGKSNLLIDFETLNKAVHKTKPSSLELSIGGDDWEYPIWVIANKYKIPIYDYRDKNTLKGSNPLLVCYFDCKSAKVRQDTFVLLEPSSEFISVPGRIEFNGSKNIRVLTAGWGDAENWGTWSISNSAKIHLKVPVDFNDMSRLEIHVRSLYIPNVLRPLTITVNRKEFLLTDLNTISSSKVLRIDNSFLKEFEGRSTLDIEFYFSNLLSPKQSGLSSDTRKLGIGIESIVAMGK
jgi:hypothetical protein